MSLSVPIYAGSSLYACLVEVLAEFRPHIEAVDGLAAIEADPVDGVAYPTTNGRIDRDFLRERLGSSGVLHGACCMVTDSRSIAALRPTFPQRARAVGAADFDASVLKDSAPRDLARSV